MVGGSRRGHVDDEALAAGAVEVEDLVGERQRADGRTPEHLLAVARPILLGAMYIMGDDQQNGPQLGGGLTRWHSHLVTCVNGNQIIAGFGVQLRGGCNPATWQDKYTAQMLHVWVVPYPGGVFSDDLSAAATSSAVRAVLAEQH